MNFFRQLWPVTAKIQAMRVHRNETPEILDDKFAKKLNLRPRKKLGFSNPKTEFFKQIANFALAS